MNPMDSVDSVDSVEERIRVAIAAARETVREVPPLRMPAPSGDSGAWLRRSRAWARRTRSLRPWLAPATAAAAVLAIGVTLVIVRNIPNGGVASSSPPAVSPAPAPSVSYSYGSPLPLPAHYVALSDTLKANSPWEVVVGDTFTGARLATVSPPAHSTFAGVTAAADDQTFVLDATTCWGAGANQCPRTWYLLRLSPAGSGVSAPLTRLPIPPTVSGTEVQGIALSPDGREFAVALQPHGPAPETLSVYSVTTGAVLRTWTGPKGTIADPEYLYERADSNSVLFWSSDGSTLSFRNETDVRMLRTSSPGRDLMTDSRLIWTYRGSEYAHGYQLSCNNTPNVAPDGTTLVCGATGEPASSVHIPSKCSAMWDNTRGFLAYSIAAPKVAHALYIGQTTCTGEVTAEILWSSPSGNALLVWLNSAPESNPGGPQSNTVGMIVQGVFQRLPFPLNGNEAIPGQVAW